MITREYGQYSLVSYVHQLRGERLNLGVVVWHPRFGFRFKQAPSLKRINCIDADADLKRVERELTLIRDTLAEWKTDQECPLLNLASHFRHDLVVSAPLKARVSDIDSFCERLSEQLIARERPTHKRDEIIRENRFWRQFSDHLNKVIPSLGVENFNSHFQETKTFQPLRIAAFFNYSGNSIVWRTSTMSASGSARHHLIKAKALYAENSELRNLQKYKNANIRLALSVPSTRRISNWDDIVEWLEKQTDVVIPIEGNRSLDELDPRRLVA